jgi:hypothetical protein
MALGCHQCADRAICGGIHKQQDAFSCLDDCCGKPESCDGMCPKNPTGFLERMREINGLTLENIPRAPRRPAIRLPNYIPYVYHGNRRTKPLDVAAIALPLRRFYRADGTLRFNSRAEIEVAFGIAVGTQIVLIGSSRDKPIETWWNLSEQRSLVLEALRKCGIALITGPNYSLFTDEVRWNDMHAMKRIGLAWQEILAAGVPGAYHLNGRTKQDYHRLTEFIASRDEVTDVVFEFRTAWRSRMPFHVIELNKLAQRVGRPLHLVMIGGIQWLPAVDAAFDRVTYVDTSAFMRAMHRQRLYLGNDGKMKKTSEFTLTGQPLDTLLAENIATMRAHIEGQFGR